MIGTTFGNFEAQAEVGRGGMAVVYRGLDTTLGRTVAIKVLHPQLAREPESRQRFQREARAVAQLRHPNIIQIYAYSGDESAHTYIVTEFVDGPDLKGFLAAHEIRLPQVAALIALKIAEALAHAHGQGIVHRDIKPENILIQKGGVPKLSDFGIAHLLDEQMTVTGAILGSPAYMSPEHIEGGATDRRADVFSLGTLLYQMASGTLPFKAEGPHALLRKILECRAPDPRLENPLVDDALLAIIQRAMERAPADRYATMEDMVADLRAYVRDEGFEDPDAALRVFFEDPEGYQAALARRLEEGLTAAARAAAAARSYGQALRLYGRVLALNDDRPDVIDEVRHLSARQRRRRRIKRAAVAAAAAAVLAVALWTAWVYLVAPRLAPVHFVRVASVTEAVAARVGPAEQAVRAELPVSPPVMITAPEHRRAPLGLLDIARSRTRRGIATQLTQPREPTTPTRPVPSRPPRPPEPADARAKNEKVPVVIKAFPPAVQIVVDGVFRGVGKTPEVPLSPGRHQVLLRHPACDICEETREVVTIDADHPPSGPLAFRIRYRPATLSVSSATQATVFVNGRRAGTTGGAIEIGMDKNRQRQLDIVVTAEGYRPWRQRVVATAGQTLRLNAVLRPVQP